MKFSVLILPILASYATASIGDLCSHGGSTGTCEKNSWCNNRKGTHDIKNLCPDDPNDVMCCFYPLCDDGQGICDVSSRGQACHGTGGHFERGFCPGPNNYLCCVYPPGS